MAIDWWHTGAALAAGIPTAIAAVAGVAQGVNKGVEIASDWRKRRELMRRPEEDRGFYVKTTHVKHVIREEATEVTKLRTIRALRDTNAIEIDHVPDIMSDPTHSEVGPVSPDFFAIPGVAFLHEGFF